MSSRGREIAVVVSRSALGPRWYGERLVRELVDQGVRAKVLDRISALSGEYLHAQLANSSRGQLTRLALRKAALVTLHDVVPRQRLLRAVLARPQARVLSRHRVVVHSQHSAALLREIGYRGTPDVVRLGADVNRLDPVDRAATRAAVNPAGDRPILVMAGVLKSERGSVEVLRSAARHPEAVFLLLGSVGDAATRGLLAQAAPNVVHWPGRSDEEFGRVLGSADILLNFRSDSVGEASAPVAIAHGWGTPVAAFLSGSMGEYAADEDFLFEPDMPVESAIATVLGRISAARRVPQDSPAVMAWRRAAGEYVAIYRELGWLG